MVDEILVRAEAIATGLGTPRRRFLQSAGGVALSLAVFDACAADGGRAGITQLHLVDETWRALRHARPD